jgi:hypothetical protein
VQWPEASPSFRELKIDAEVRRQLRYDQGHAASWTLPAATSAATFGRPKPSSITCLLYLFRWKPGRNSALLANLHRPDVCLPAVGWSQTADTGVRNYRVTGPIKLPFRHFEFHRVLENSVPQTAHAFYCLLEDRAPEPSAAGASPPQMFGSRSSWTRAERLRAVLEGRRHLGQQAIEVVFISSEAVSTTDAELLLRDMLRDVVVLRQPDKANNKR